MPADDKGQDQRVTKPRGRPSVEIPALGQKIEYLLTHVGRLHGWLTEVVSDLNGHHPSLPSITAWKSSERMPSDYVVSFCTQFSITRAILEETDFGRFKAAVDNVSAPGSGIAWKRLLRKAREPHDGLQLEVEGQAPARRLRNVYFPADAPPPVVEKKVAHVHRDQRIRFMLPANEFLSDTGAMIKVGTVVLCCEDPLGWKTLCPHPRDPGFVLEGKRWLLPGSTRGSLFLGGPLGQYRALAVITEEPLPQPIHAELRADRTVVGTDMLANWLASEAIPAVVLQREFLVIGPRGPFRAGVN